MHTKRHERDTAEGGREYASNLVANLQVPAIVDRTWRLEKTQKYHTRMLVFNNVMLAVVIAKLFFPELALIAKRFFPKQSVKPLLPEQSTQAVHALMPILFLLIVLVIIDVGLHARRFLVAAAAPAAAPTSASAAAPAAAAARGLSATEGGHASGSSAAPATPIPAAHSPRPPSPATPPLTPGPLSRLTGCLSAPQDTPDSHEIFKLKMQTVISGADRDGSAGLYIEEKAARAVSKLQALGELSRTHSRANTP
jgi:hypothetical protein